MNSAWDLLRLYETEPAARRFLVHSYQSLGVPSAEKLAFQRCTRFMYTLRQARSFYEGARLGDPLIRPLLLFYGCVHLLKTVLLLKDPSYPSHSRMLQHGVTTRKIKRSPYSWMQDEVRVQKEGLFACLAQHLNPFPLQDKYNVEQLYDNLPGLSRETEWVLGRRKWAEAKVVSKDPLILSVPEDTSGPLQYSAETLARFLQRHAPDGFSFHGQDTPEQKQLVVHFPKNRALSDHVLFVPDEKSDTYLLYNGDPSERIPAWAVHYMLLYQLSILCRYESEWWGELILSHSLSEAYLVEQFFRYHQETFPQLTVDMLLQTK